MTPRDLGAAAFACGYDMSVYRGLLTPSEQEEYDSRWLEAEYLDELNKNQVAMCAEFKRPMEVLNDFS